MVIFNIIEEDTIQTLQQVEDLTFTHPARYMYLILAQD